MKKILSYIMLLFFMFGIVGNSTYATTFIQKSARQNSSAVANNDPVTAGKWNSVVLDVSNIIEDIGGLKAYIDGNINNTFVITATRMENTDRDISISKKLLVGETLTTNSLDLDVGGLKDDTIMSNNIKDGSIKLEDFASTVSFGNQEYWTQVGLNTYYNDGNVAVGQNTADEKLVVNGNLHIRTNGNGILFPDGTMQTTALMGPDNALLLTSDQEVNGLKTFQDTISFQDNNQINTIKDITTAFVTPDNNSLVTSDAIKKIVKENKVSKLPGKCGGDNGRFLMEEPQLLCEYGTPTEVLLNENGNISSVGDTTEPIIINRDGLVLEYILDGDVNDTSGNNYNGTINGSIDFDNINRENVNTGAYTNNSNSNYISYPTLNQLDKGTISINFKLNNKFSSTDSSSITLFNGNKVGTNTGDFQLQLRQDLGQAYFRSEVAGINLLSNKNVWEPNVWYNLVVTWDGTKKDMYIDGNFESTINDSSPYFSSAQTQKYIGQDSASKGLTLSTLRVYDKVLSSEDITNLAKEGIPTTIQDPLLDGLVGYWAFNGNATNLIDNQTATVSGPVLVNDQIGNSNSAYSFDGSNDKITVTSEDKFKLDKYTVGVWFKRDNSNDNVMLLGKSSAYSDDNGLNINYSILVKNNKISTYYEGEGGGADYIASSDSGYSDNNWHLAIGTYDGNQLKIYIDGNEKGSLNTTAIPEKNDKDIGIGYGSGNNSQYFGGDISSALIYNRALSSSEITDLYNETKVDYLIEQPSTLTNGLISYYDLKSGDTSNKINGVDRGVNGTTSVTDQLGNNGDALGIGHNTTDYLKTDYDSMSGLGDFTFTFLAKRTGSNNDGYTFLNAVGTGDDDIWLFDRINGDYTRVMINNNEVRFNGVHTQYSQDTNWHTISFTREGGTYKVFSDGLLQGTKTGGYTGAIMSLVDAQIGQESDSAGNMANFDVNQTLSGDLSAHLVYNRALSDTEISELSNTLLNGYLDIGSSSSSSNNTIYKSCRELRESKNSIASGIYTINPGNGNINVYCDMETNGGGRTRFLKYKESDGGKTPGTQSSSTSYKLAITPDTTDVKVLLNGCNANETTLELNLDGHNPVQMYKWIQSSENTALSNAANANTVYTTTDINGNTIRYGHNNSDASNEFEAFTFSTHHHTSYDQIRKYAKWGVIDGGNGNTRSSYNNVTSYANGDMGNSDDWVCAYYRDIVPTIPAPEPELIDTYYQWSCVSEDEVEQQCGAYLDPNSIEKITIVNDGTSRKYSDGTVAKTCNDYKNPTDIETYPYEGDIGDGVYTINPNGTEVNVYCDMTTDGGGWTLVYKGNGQHTMKTTGSSNIDTLKVADFSGTGKLSDTDIKKIYTTQFKIEENGYYDWYCKFADINSYADNAITNKYCSSSYKADGSYTTLHDNTSRQHGFSTRDGEGARILQLNYADSSRKGAHVVNTSNRTAGTCDVKNSGNDRYGCHDKIWVK